MIDFNGVATTAQLLGYITFLVGAAALGSAGIVTIERMLKAVFAPRAVLDEPVKVRLRRVKPENLFWEMNGEGRLTDAIELSDDHKTVVEEFHFPDDPTAPDCHPHVHDDFVSDGTHYNIPHSPGTPHFHPHVAGHHA